MGGGDGAPMPVETVAEMTDTTKVYLYVGSEAGYTFGNWYYYDGNDWVSGGKWGADGGVNTNARNLLQYILERVAYTDTDMEVYVNALYEALAQAGAVTTTYTITNALLHVTNSNSAGGADSGDSYSATLTADAGYAIDTVTITMGGVDITSTAYTSGTGAISIASVTGNIVITASATYQETWDINWDYTMGDPTSNGWTAGTVAGTMISTGYQMKGTSSGGCTLAHNPDVSYTKGVIEVVMNITTMSTTYQGMCLFSKGMRLRVYNNKLWIDCTSTNTEASQTEISSITDNADHTIRWEYDTTSYARVYLDGVLVHTHTGSLNATASRLFLNGTYGGVGATTNIAVVKSIKCREVS